MASLGEQNGNRQIICERRPYRQRQSLDRNFPSNRHFHHSHRNALVCAARHSSTCAKNRGSPPPYLASFCSRAASASFPVVPANLSTATASSAIRRQVPKWIVGKRQASSCTHGRNAECGRPCEMLHAPFSVKAVQLGPHEPGQIRTARSIAEVALSVPSQEALTSGSLSLKTRPFAPIVNHSWPCRPNLLAYSLCERLLSSQPCRLVLP